MQTTLRVDDALYREAKSQASREGISMSQLFNQALRVRILTANQKKTKKIHLAVFKRDKKGSKVLSPSEIKEMLNQMDIDREARFFSR